MKTLFSFLFALVVSEPVTAQPLPPVIWKQQPGDLNANYYQFILDMAMQGASLKEADSIQLDSVRAWANQQSPVGFLALNLLYLTNNESYAEQIPVIDTGGNVLRQSAEQSGESTLLLIPNPATDHVTITRSAAGNTGSVDVLDFTGRPVAQLILDASQTSVSLSTVDWPDGIYLVTLNAADATSRNAKLIIAR